jgi:hypothetical protein
MCGFLLASILISGCASKQSEIKDFGDPVVFVDSLSDQVSELFPLSDWGQTKTTLYAPEVEYSESTGGIWVRLQGQTWNWDERRYRYTVSMLTVPEVDTDKGIVYLTPSREIIWDLANVPRLYKQQVIDMTQPMLIDALSDRGFTKVRFERRPIYHE